MKNFTCRKAIVMIALLGTIALWCSPASAQAPASMTIVASPKELKWGPLPPSLSKGAQLAVLDGDPSKPGLYTVRLKMPSGYKVAPHSHPENVNVSVLSGTFGVGMGDKFDSSNGKLVKAGGFVVEPKGMHHYAWAQGATVIQLHGAGPLVINYVNPADDPSAAQH